MERMVFQAPGHVRSRSNANRPAPTQPKGVSEIMQVSLAGHILMIEADLDEQWFVEALYDVLKDELSRESLTDFLTDRAEETGQ